MRYFIAFMVIFTSQYLTEAMANRSLAKKEVLDYGWLDSTHLANVSQEKARLRSFPRDSISDRAEKSIGEWIWFFTHDKPSLFQGFLDRLPDYGKMIVTKLKAAKLPPELLYLCMIESGFRNHAKSHAGAAGLWQFMPATARRYGLKVGKGVDERYHPEKATDAAISYLIDLYNVFQSWPLAASAYNAGEGRIVRAIMASNSRRYWEISRKTFFPKETAEYVGRWFAAVLLGRSPAKYGFHTIRSAREGVSNVILKSPMSFTKLARLCKVPEKTLVKLNPHLAINWYRRGHRSASIRLPQNKCTNIAT